AGILGAAFRFQRTGLTIGGLGPVLVVGPPRPLFLALIPEGLAPRTGIAVAGSLIRKGLGPKGRIPSPPVHLPDRLRAPAPQRADEIHPPLVEGQDIGPAGKAPVGHYL